MDDKKKAPAEQEHQDSVYVQKWGQLLIAGGYCVVPNIIIQRHRQLGLDAEDLGIVMQLCCFWWKPGDWLTCPLL